MANKETVWTLRGRMEIQDILNSIGQIENRMGQLKPDTKGLSGFGKEITSLKGSAEKLQAEMQRDFKTPAELQSFIKKVEDLRTKIALTEERTKGFKYSFSDIDISKLSSEMIAKLDSLGSKLASTLGPYEQAINNLQQRIANFGNRTKLNLGEDELQELTNILSTQENQEERLADFKQRKLASMRDELELQKQLKAEAEKELKETGTAIAHKNDEIAKIESSIGKNKTEQEKIKEADPDGKDKAKQARYRQLENEITQQRGIRSNLVSERTKLGKDYGSQKTTIENADTAIKNLTTTTQKLDQIMSGLVGNTQGFDAATRAQINGINTAKGAAITATTARDTAAAELQQAQAEATASIGLKPEDTKQNFEEMSDGLRRVGEEGREAKNSMEAFGRTQSKLEGVKNSINRIVGAAAAFGLIRRAINSSINAIKELDAAFTEIAVVTNKTNSQLWESFDEYNKMAQELGTTTAKAIQTSALYYQQGLETAEVMKLTEETIKMARIAGMDYAEATDRMTAALRGFKLEMEDAQRVNDVFSALAAKSAVDTDELSEALTKTASIAKSAGFEIETLSAFLAQGIETTRESASNIGTAMKTVIARFQELKTAVGEGVEIDDEMVDVNKVDTALKSVGVSLRDNLTGQFRNLDEVFLELSSKWDTLDRNTQRYVATIAAGSRQQSRFIAFMDDYARTTELVDIAQNSSGASASQFAKTLDSIEAKTNKVKASFEELTGTLIDNGFVKMLLDGVNNVMQMVNRVAEMGPVAFIAWGVAFYALLRTITTSVGNGITTMGNKLLKTIETATEQGLTIGGKKGSQNLQNSVSNATKNGASGSDKPMPGTIPLKNGLHLSQTQLQLTSTIANLITSFTMLGAAADSTSAAMGATTGAGVGSAAGSIIGLIGGPAGAMVGQAIGGALGSVIGSQVGPWLDELKHGIGSEKNIKLLEKIAKNTGERNSQIIEKNDDFLELSQEYQELAQKAVLTNEEQSKLAEISNKLVEIDEDLVGSYDDEIGARRLLIEELQKETKLRLLENTRAEIESQGDTVRTEYAKSNPQEKYGGQTYGNYDEVGMSNVSPFYWTSAIESTEINQILDAYNGKLKELGYITSGKVSLQTSTSGSVLANGHYISEFSFEDLLAQGITLEDFKGLEEVPEFKAVFSDYEKFLSNFQDGIAKIQDATFQYVTAITSDIQNSYAGKNQNILKDYISGLRTDAQWQEYMSYEAGSEEEKKWLADYQKEAEAKTEEMTAAMNALTLEEQTAFENALNMMGMTDMFGYGDGNASYIMNYLGNTLGANSQSSKKVEYLLNNLSTEFIENQKSQWGGLIGTAQEDIINRIAQTNQLAALQYGTIVRGIGQENQVFIDAFGKQFENILESTTLKNKDKIIATIGEYGLRAKDSIYWSAVLQNKLTDLGLSADEAANMVSSIGDSFKKVGYDAESAFELIGTRFEKMQDQAEKLKGLIAGEGSLEDFKEIQNTYQELTGGYFSSDYVNITGEGIKIDQLAADRLTSMSFKNYQKEQNAMAEMAKKQAVYAENMMNQFTVGSEEWEKWRKEATDAYNAAQQYLIAPLLLQKQYMLDSAKAAKDNAEAIKDAYAELERYYNFQRKKTHLDADYGLMETELGLDSTSKERSYDLREGQLLNIRTRRELANEQIKRYDNDRKVMQNFINTNYGDYLSFDENGNIMQNNKAYIKLIKDMEDAAKKGDEAEVEAIQAKIDIIDETKEAYAEQYDLVQGAQQEYLDTLKEEQEFLNARYDEIITVQQKIGDLIIKEQQEELAAVKKKYDQIKNEDQKYLNALQKNLNKRKKMQEKADSENEIKKLQNRIALLSRDTSGIYAKELEELQNELNEKLRERENNTLDTLYEEEQEKTEITANELDKRATYLQEALDEEVKTRKRTNEEINKLMQEGEEAILEWMKDRDEEFVNGTDEQQQKWINSWTNSIKNALNSQELLTSINTLDKNLSGMFKDLDTEGMKPYTDAIGELEEAINKVSEAIQSSINLMEEFAKLNGEMTNNELELQTQNEINSLMEQMRSAERSGDTEKMDSIANEMNATISNYFKKSGAESFTNGTITVNKDDTGSSSFGEKAKKQSSYNDPIAKGYSYYFDVGGDTPPYYYVPYSTDKTPQNIKFLPQNPNEALQFENNPLSYPFTHNGESVTAMTLTDGTVRWFPTRYFKNINGNKYFAYKTGGMVDYTGPAWVDGTPSRPEAFLSAADTANIASLRDILSRVFRASRLDTTAQNENSGDTYYEFHINVDKLGDKYDTELLMKDIENYIVQKANYRRVSKISRR